MTLNCGCPEDPCGIDCPLHPRVPLHLLTRPTPIKPDR
jgi:hypothetical protein